MATSRSKRRYSLLSRNAPIFRLGLLVGVLVGLGESPTIDGLDVLGFLEGAARGDVLGLLDDGRVVGRQLGLDVGKLVGTSDGCEDGTAEGCMLGIMDG